MGITLYKFAYSSEDTTAQNKSPSTYALSRPIEADRSGVQKAFWNWTRLSATVLPRQMSNARSRPIALFFCPYFPSCLLYTVYNNNIHMPVSGVKSHEVYPPDLKPRCISSGNSWYNAAQAVSIFFDGWLTAEWLSRRVLKYVAPHKSKV